MKSSYELAMERLGKSSPSVKLTGEQKAQLAELDSVYSAKIAEKEIYIKDELTKARANGDPMSYMDAEQRLINERQSLKAELEEKKEAIRNKKS